MHTRPGAYSQVFRGTGPSGLERARENSSRGLEPGFQDVQAQTGMYWARAPCPRGVQPGFPGVLAQTGSNRHVHTRPGVVQTGFLWRTGPNGLERGTCILVRGLKACTPGKPGYTPLYEVTRACTFRFGSVRPQNLALHPLTSMHVPVWACTPGKPGCTRLGECVRASLDQFGLVLPGNLAVPTMKSVHVPGRTP